MKVFFEMHPPAGRAGRSLRKEKKTKTELKTAIFQQIEKV
jgi:hypothetical protein